VAATHVLGESLDPVGVVTLEAEVFARDVDELRGAVDVRDDNNQQLERMMAA
jgi:hypothetical protein